MQKFNQPTRPLIQETALLLALSSQSARHGAGMKRKDARCTQRANSLATSLARQALLALAFDVEWYKVYRAWKYRLLFEFYLLDKTLIYAAYFNDTFISQSRHLYQ